MTNEHLSETPLEQSREAKLHQQLAAVIAHVDTLDFQRRAQGIAKSWRDYISPFIDAAHRVGVDLEEDEASNYVRDYLDRRDRRDSVPGDPDAEASWEEKGTTDNIRDIALDRLGAAALTTDTQPLEIQPEAEGENS